MRIISNTHDYYDGLMSVDQDRETLYVRKRTEMELDEADVPQFPKFEPGMLWGQNYWPHTIQSIERYIIGFCGKIYPMAVIRLESYYQDGAVVRCFNMDDVDAFFENNFDDEEVVAYKGKTRGKWNRLGWSDWRTRKAWVEFFDGVAKGEDSYQNLFDEHQTPVFSYREHKRGWSLVLNPILKDLEFFRLFPAYQAYQELVVWHCNLTNPEKPIPKVDDETMASIKGFDKFSFRKPKRI